MADQEAASRAPGPASRQPIEGYELLRKLGEGGMGAVYLARQVSMDRQVALKILRRNLARNGEFVERFVREARLAGQLDHPNLVRALDVGRSGEYHYLAMEFVEGRTLAEVLREKGRMAEKEALEIVAQVARALEYARSRGVIHRDVKPENVLVAGDGAAKLTDMGLAKQTGAESHLTHTGMMVGTPHYVSPEQARGDADVDIRGDIYSLGATLYRLITGRTPFEGSSAAVVMTKHLTEEPPPPREVNPDVSLNLCRVIYKAMAKKREARYQTPAEMLSDVEALLAGRLPRLAMSRRREDGTLETRPVSGVRRRSAGGLAGPQDPAGGASRRWPLPLPALAGIAGGLVLAAGLGVWALTRRGPEPLPPPPPPKEETVVQPPPAEPPPAAEKNFEEMYGYAAGFWQKNPGLHDEAAAKFETVRRDAAGTVWSMKADDMLKAIAAARAAAAEAAAAEVRARAEALAGAGDFDAAVAVWGRPPAGFEKLLAARCEEERGRLRRAAEEKFGAALAAAEQHSADGRPTEGLTALDAVAGVKFAALAPRAAALRQRLAKEQLDAAALGEKRRQAEARKALAGILDRFDELVYAGRHVEAGRSLAEARGKAGAETAALIAAELDAAVRVAGALSARAAERAKALENLRGREVTLSKRDGSVHTVKIVAVKPEVLSVERRFKLGTDWQTAGYDIAFAELADGQIEKLLPAYAPGDADGQVAAAILAMAEKDVSAAEKALAAAGEHAFSTRYREKVEVLRLGETEAAARRAWESGVEVREKYDLAGAKRLLAALEAFGKAHGATRFAQGQAAEAARLTELANAAVEASPEGLLARVRKLYRGSVKRFDPRTMEIELVYDFADPGQLGDWEQSGFAAGGLKGEPPKLDGGRLQLTNSGRPVLLKGLFRSMSIAADFEVLGGKGNCTLLVCADDRGNWYNLFGMQELGNSYIERYVAGKWSTLGTPRPSPFAAARKGSFALTFRDGRLAGQVGGLNLDVEDKTYPYGRVGLWAFDTRAAYDNVRVTGVLDKTWLEEQLARLAAGSAPRRRFAARWQELSPRGETPPGRSNCYRGMIYDSKRRLGVLFGGHHTNMNDLWTLDPAVPQWTCLQRNQPEGGGVGETRPKGRTHMLLVYDEARDLYWLNDDWLYSPAAGAWRTNAVPLAGLKNPPYAPWLRPGFAYDPDGRRMLWWKERGSWVHLGRNEAEPIPDGPPGRTYVDGGLAYDRGEKVFVLHAGAIHAGETLNDTWTFDPATARWRQLRPEASPPPRVEHRLHWSPALKAMVMVGGQVDSKDRSNDVWVLETAAERWTELKPAGGPAAGPMATTYDEARECALVFNSRGQTWLLRIEATGGK